MKSMKQKYMGMKRAELVKALETVRKSITHTNMMLLDDPKAHAQLFKFRYERALIRTLLQKPDNT